jgi:outer membrane immunogenic protein
MLRSVFSAGAISALAFGLLSTSSLAQSAPPPSNWSGFSVSVGGGAAKTDTSLLSTTENTDDLGIFFSIIELAGRASGSSAIGTDDWEGFGTLQAAYDFRFGNVVAGVLADFDFYPDNPGAAATQSIDGSLAVSFFGFPLGSIPIDDYATVTSNIELKNVWSIGGRLGYLVNRNTLVYALGGYTEARTEGQIDLSYLNLFTGPQTLSLRAPDELRGYFVGGGGEFQVAQNLALRLEYRYANYHGESSSAATDFDASIFGGFITYEQAAKINADLDAQIHSVRGALVLKLGEP